MFDRNSRYANIGTSVLTEQQADGSSREIRYLQRRFIPAAEEMTVLVEHRFAQGERLDTVTAGYLGDPLQFWRICDANEVRDPEELERVGRSIRIALPGLQG
jgi:hypothetical protein